MNRLTASLLVLLGAACYGLIGPFVKMAYDAGFSPQDLTSSQFFMAFLVLGILAAFQGRGLLRLRRKDIGMLSLLGVLATGTSVFYYVSLSYLPASLGIVLLFQFAWIVMLIDFIMTRNKPDKMKWISLLFILVGTIFGVDLFKTDWTQVSGFGLLMGLLSSITYAAFLYLNEKVESKAPAIINSFVLTGISTITIFFVFPPKFLVNGTLGEGLWVWALIVGCLGQVIPPIMFNKGIPVVGGAIAGILASVELPVAVVASSLLLGEKVSPVRWFGILLVVAGILIAEMKTGQAKLGNPKNA